MLRPASLRRTTHVISSDTVIIGAGAAGLFAVFELGLLGLKAHVIDSLPQAGGQCIELYPDKPIYDIPAVPVCTARELVERLRLQIQPFAPQFHLGETVTAVQRTEHGRLRLTTSAGTQVDTGTLIIAGGIGAFAPRTLAVPEAASVLGKALHYKVTDPTIFNDRDLVIAGGGDAALDWTLALVERARSIVLVHRSGKFRGAPANVARMRALCDAGRMQFLEGDVIGLDVMEGQLHAVRVRTPSGMVRRVEAAQLLVLWGLHPALGPIANWGLAMERQQLLVDTATFQTSAPGIFAIGDISTYPGKKKLILSGFHEAALCAFAVREHLNPGEKVHLQYTTTSPALQRRLGVTVDAGDDSGRKDTGTALAPASAG